MAMDATGNLAEAGHPEEAERASRVIDAERKSVISAGPAAMSFSNPADLSRVKSLGETRCTRSWSSLDPQHHHHHGCTSKPWRCLGGVLGESDFAYRAKWDLKTQTVQMAGRDQKIEHDPRFQEAVAIYKCRMHYLSNGAPWEVTEASRNLVEAYDEVGDHPEAEKEIELLIARFSQKPKSDTEDVLEDLYGQLADEYEAQGKAAEAERYHRMASTKLDRPFGSR